ncbi:MAG: hypothetical protein A2298_00740, partial [Gammaproteobacteria bacterium RIFOXYB2_FULL_38_6]
VTMIQNTANQLMQQLSAHQAVLHSPKADAFIRQLVNKQVVPIIDTYRMAGSVVGRAYWNQATPAQRNQFIEQFKRLVISTYSAALASYDDDKVVVYPLRNSATNNHAVRVRSEIIRKNGQHIPIVYDLSKTSNGWKVYDFSIESVSITESYRSQFAGTLSQGGLPNLITKLKAHNQRIAA